MSRRARLVAFWVTRETIDGWAEPLAHVAVSPHGVLAASGTRRHGPTTQRGLIARCQATVPSELSTTLVVLVDLCRLLDVRRPSSEHHYMLTRPITPP